MVSMLANNGVIPFSPAELLLIAGYLGILIAIGAVGYFARRENSLQDFYLAGPGIGFFVLLLTLYATQYSGNTLIGFTGQTYKIGFQWTVSIQFMTAIVVFYLTFAPKLHRLAKKHGFITPADYVQHRFQSRWLTCLTSLMLILGVANFLVSQLMAMGRAMQGLTDANSMVAYTIGVVLLALIVVVYESFGGFRAVAWTDAFQGGILLLGFALLFVLVLSQFGSLDSATRQLVEQDLERQANSAPGESPKLLAHPPGVTETLRWCSYILVVGIGGALYPQAIQRIYAAREAKALQRSLAIMAFLPLVTTLISLIVGVVAIAYLPPIDPADSDTVLPELCRRVQESSWFGRVLVAILFSALLAALMSTADSILLSISSMFARDLFPLLSKQEPSQAKSTKVGKVVSWLVMIAAVAVALILNLTGHANVVTLLDRKFDLLLQIAPAFILGIHWKRLHATPVIAGLLVGLVVALLLSMTGETDKPFGVHAGLYGLAVNLVIATVGSLLMRDKSETTQSISETPTAS